MKMLAVSCALLFAPVDVNAILEKLDKWLDQQIAAAVDAGAPVDAGKPDAGVDAGKVDAGVADAGRDAGSVVDAGQPGPGDTAMRPAASKGVGFFVVGSKIYDGNGNRVVLRGSNRVHIDSQSKWYAQTAANATRLLIDPEPYIAFSYERTLQAMTDQNMGGTTTNGQDVQIPGMWKSTCSSDLGLFETIVSRWVATAARFQASSERYMILNIANEALSDELVWRDRYIDAVQRIRAAGYHGLLAIDPPGCGQNAMAVVRHGAAVLAADPEKNLLWDVHLYGLWHDSQGGIPKQYAEQLDLVPTMDALAATGMAIMIGEFGPGRNIGPSPTMITPQRVVAMAEARGFSWLTWGLDDHNLPNERADDNGFGHSRDATYQNLTIWGAQAEAMWKQYGAKTASIFEQQTLVARSARAALVAPRPMVTQPITKTLNMKLTPVKR